MIFIASSSVRWALRPTFVIESGIRKILPPLYFHVFCERTDIPFVEDWRSFQIQNLQQMPEPGLFGLVVKRSFAGCSNHCPLDTAGARQEVLSHVPGERFDTHPSYGNLD